jgi:hypothetical protein
MATKYRLTKEGQAWLDAQPGARLCSLVTLLLAFEGGPLDRGEALAKMGAMRRHGAEKGASARFLGTVDRAMGLVRPAFDDAVRRGLLGPAE